MKKLIFLLLTTCAVCLMAQTPVLAQDSKTMNEQMEPPPAIVEKFKNEYPAITPSWRMDGKNFIADFVDPNTLKGSSIVYDKDGNVIRRESELENSTYPSSINEYYIKKYPGEKFKTWRSQDSKGAQSYYIRRASGLVWFDNDGNAIEPQKKN